MNGREHYIQDNLMVVNRFTIATRWECEAAHLKLSLKGLKWIIWGLLPIRWGISWHHFMNSIYDIFFLR